MRTQAVSESQFREISSAPADKGAASRDDFAAVLHQATGDVVPMASHTTAKEQGAADPEESLPAEEPKISSPSQQVQAAVAQSLTSKHPAKVSVVSVLPAHAIVMKAATGGLNFDASEASAIPAVDDPVAPVPEALGTPFASLPQPSPVSDPDAKGGQEIRPRVVVNGITVPANGVVDNEKLTNATIVAGEGKPAKYSVSSAKTTSGKPTVEGQETTAVPGWGGANLSPNMAAGGALLPSMVVPQNQPVVPETGVPASEVSGPVIAANKTIRSAGQLAIAQRGEVVADRKAGVKAADDATSSTKACDTKDVSSDSSNDAAPAIPSLGTSEHSIPATVALASVPPASGGHPVESRVVAPALPMAHVLTSETAGLVATSELQSNPTGGGMLPHAMLSSTTTSLEVGVASGTHGWLKIRAEMTGSGEVNASLTGRSSVAANRLRDDLPALSSYLQVEKVQVNGLNVHTELAATALSSEARSGYDGSGGFAGNIDGGAGGGRSQQQEGQGSGTASVLIDREERLEIQPGRASDLVMSGHGVGLGGKVNLPSVEYGIGGGWLNVRA